MELDNLKYYCIVDIKTEFVPEAYVENNHYLVTYTIMEINSLEKIIIYEEIKPDLISNDTFNGLDSTLASILLENGVDPYQMNYKHLCKFGAFNYKCDNIHDYCIEPAHYFFNGVPLQEPITEWEHILHIPSSERQDQRIKTEINRNLETIVYELSKHNDTLTSIEKALDLGNYLAQS